MNRVGTVSTALSAIVCCLLLVLLPATYHVVLCDLSNSKGLSPHASISLTSHARCGISRGGLWFFSLDCPYSGSIMHIAADKDHIFYDHGRLARIARDRNWIFGDFGFVQESFIGEKNDFVGQDRAADFPGVYYRHFEWWNQEPPWWTLRVSLWYPIVFFAILPLCRLFRRKGFLLKKILPDRGAPANRCPSGQPDGSENL